jgi:hypothetical protein
MRVKLFEIRDRLTLIPAFAFRAQPTEFGEQIESELFLLAKAGYGLTGSSECVVVGKLIGEECQYDCYSWKGGARTMPVAHNYIQKNFDTLKSGEVIDVEFILGETTTKKQSEIFYEHRTP